MIRKLRAKFLILSMTSLLLVLLVIIASVNIYNYIDITTQADTMLSYLAENDGQFPQIGGVEIGNPEELTFPTDLSTSGGIPPEAREDDPDHAGDYSFSPEAQYENRYFSVKTTDTGRVIEVDIGMISAVDETQAIAYVTIAMDNDNSSGFIDNYRYKSYSVGNDATMYIFLDCSRSIQNFRSFLLASIMFSVLGMLIVFVVLLLVSKRIIKPVAESYEKQRRFITDAGHEIKTPLTVIDADTELLAMESGDNEWLADIKSQTKRLATLTNDLISLSRLDESGDLNMIVFPFSDLVEDELQSFKSRATLSKAEFISEIQPMLSVKGDEKALRHMLSVLIDNAIKYTTEDGYISANLSRVGRNVRFTISNTVATPLSKTQIEHMFDRFYRVDESRSKDSGGYGLGLSIASAVVAAHTGKISASMDGKSLTICVLLKAEEL